MAASVCDLFSQKMTETNESHHVLIFPLPIQGPVNSMLNLAQLISLASAGAIKVTFLTTEHVHRRLLLHAGAHLDGLTFRTFPDGLPEAHPRGGDKFMEMLEAVEEVSRPLLRDLIIRGSGSTNNICEPPVTCVVADGLFDFALGIGNEGGVPVIYFDTISPSCLWVYLCVPRLFEDGKIPFRENDDLDALVGVPGMETILRRRDLPDFCRADYPSSNILIHRITQQANRFKEAQGIILNTFVELEAHVLAYISQWVNKVYVIGPLHLHLKERMQTLALSTRTSCSNSLWHEDMNCIKWLDQQLRKSVIYCSLGSHVIITKEQLVEFWHGLINSGIHFIWVKRPGSIIGMDDDNDDVPTDLLNAVQKRGYIVSWAPQEEVLRHPSIGGFLTHSGWNSTMESIAEGVPMTCWPHYVDQLVNSRCVSEVWKIGVDIKDTCNRVTVENTVTDLMHRRRDEYSENANRLAALAKRSVNRGGSSYCALVRLIDDMKSFQIPSKSPQ